MSLRYLVKRFHQLWRTGTQYKSATIRVFSDGCARNVVRAR